MPSNRLKSAAPTFLVGDGATTAEWYEKQLGFIASFAPKELPHFYAPPLLNELGSPTAAALTP
jgi:hypothetical protein